MFTKIKDLLSGCFKQEQKQSISVQINNNAASSTNIENEDDSYTPIPDDKLLENELNRCYSLTSKGNRCLFKTLNCPHHKEYNKIMLVRLLRRYFRDDTKIYHKQGIFQLNIADILKQ